MNGTNGSSSPGDSSYSPETVSPGSPNNHDSSQSQDNVPPGDNDPSTAHGSTSSTFIRPPNIHVFWEGTLANHGVITFGSYGVRLYGTYCDTLTQLSMLNMAPGATVVKYVLDPDFDSLARPEPGQGTEVKLQVDDRRREVVAMASDGLHRDIVSLGECWP
jgi:hypothetical protein